jgi:phytoene dehydrogenase-like protein
MALITYDAIIVGGGIAGLTSATYLARAGKKIILIEKNHELGGLVNSFERDGFVFDAGVRAILDAGIILTMLKDLDIHLELVPSTVSVGIEDKIINIEDLSSIDEYRDLLIGLYPDSTEDINKFIASMRKIMKLLDVLYGVENPVFKDIKKDKEYFLKTLVPWLPKFLLTIGKINRLSKPCEEYLKGMIKNPSLIDIISQHFFKNTPTFFALSYFTLYLSYLYPKGGIGVLPSALVEKINESKGEILTNTYVKEVDADQQFVVDEKNNKYYYKNLVWAADLTTFYEITRVGNLKPGVKSNFQMTKEKTNQGKPGESVFSLYLEVDLPASYFKSISNGHFFYTPSKYGLGSIHRGDLTKMLDNWEDLEKETVFTWLDSFLKYNTFEISIPALRDSRLVPEGKTGLMVSILVDYELFDKLKSSGWVDEFRNEIENKIINILSVTVYPGLKDKVEKQFSFTPLSIEERVGSTGGAIVGWSFEAPIPVVHKMQDVSKSVITPIPNIFQAGQWAYNPAGLPMCIMTGKLAADKIMK